MTSVQPFSEQSVRYLRTLSRESLVSLQAELRRKSEIQKARRKLWTYFPDEGPLRRELYPKHLEFFRAGATHKERAFIAANRVGKTESGGGYEMTLHLTGIYPEWWEGRRWDRPVTAWICGETIKDVRDSLQKKILGEPGNYGTGLIPHDNLLRFTARSGVPDAVDTFYVKHRNGGTSTATFKSYDTGRESFQAADLDIIWMDEECPLAIYTEALMRTMTTDGMAYLTFTPLKGLTELVASFLPGGVLPL